MPTQALPMQALVTALIYIVAIALYIWFLLLPIFIFRRCGNILRRLERIERFLGTQDN